MGFNLDFLYASIVVCIVLLFHFLLTVKNNKVQMNRWIAIIVLISLFVTVVDIFDSIFIDSASKVNIYTLYTMDIFLYIAQLTLPCLLYFFSLNITGNFIKGQRAFVVYIPLAMYIAACALIIFTPLTGLVFTFDANNANAYSYGPMFMLVYAIAAFLGACVLGIMVVNHKYLRRNDCLVICLDVLIILAVTIIQSFVPKLCLVGFGAAIGSLALYVSFTDSSGLRDSNTGVLEPAELRRRISLLTHRGSYYNVTFITIDNRRYLNNSLGPDVVDAALRLIADHLIEVYRSEQIYKFQGARFCILTYDDLETSTLRSEMESWLAENHKVGNHDITFDARVTALYDVGKIASDLDLESFVDFLFDEAHTMKGEKVDQRALKEGYTEFAAANAALKRALTDDTFEIFLQPLYNVATGKFSSVEVLSRLKGEDGRYISPGVFIGIAEDNGTISKVSDLQFDRLCRFLSKNRMRLERMGVTDVKYNVSHAEITTSDRADRALEVIKKYDLDPKLFSFEVTENVAYSGSDVLINMMKEVQAAGCRVYMDDFGSGYANLETVFRMPFDGVKLDITLLRLMRNDERAATFYRSLVSTLHALNLTIVSEGVEEAEEAELLSEWGVDVIQGFYYSKPLPESLYLNFLDEANR